MKPTAKTQVVLHNWLAHFERLLRVERSKTPATKSGYFVCGTRLTYADVALYDTIRACESISLLGFKVDCEENKEKYPLVARLVAAVHEKFPDPDFEARDVVQELVDKYTGASSKGKKAA
eukprot:g8863.t1